MNITEVVETDHRLEAGAATAQEALARHRWHWTLDESNPERMSIREYARQAARAFTAVRDMVQGYAEVVAQPDRNIPITDAIARAGMAGERLAAAEAIAEAKGTNVANVRGNYAPEIREVREEARARSEERGTPVEEEIQHVAQQRERVRKAFRSRDADQKARHDMVWIAVERDVASAMRYIRNALSTSEGVEFTEEERELLRSSIGKLKAVLNLLDMRATGVADVDWDAELAKIGDPA